MLAPLVNRVMSRRRPDLVGPGFFVWRLFNRKWIAFSLRFDDDYRPPGAALPEAPVSFRFFVVSGEVLLHTWPDGPGRQIMSYPCPECGDEIGVYSVKAGESFRVLAGAPLKLELVPQAEACETFFPNWMLPGEARTRSRKPARMVVIRSLLTRVR